MLRSPTPDRQLLCVKCGRDTTSSLPNGTGSSSPPVSGDNRPPASYHPFLNGDDMDSEEVEPEGGMHVDRTIPHNQLNRIFPSVSILIA
jgi:hypothetical protein